MKMAAPILLAAYGGGHVAMILPLARELMRRGYEVRVLALTSAIAVLKDAGIETITYGEFPEAQDPEALHYGKTMTEGMSLSESIPLSETIAYMGVNYKELVDELGEEQAAISYRQRGRWAFLPFRTMEHLLRRLKPSVVVATNSPRTEKALIISARKLGIPAVCVIDLWEDDVIRQWIGKPGYADLICVLDETVRTTLLECGRHDDEVLVSGNPAFDILRQEDVIAHGKNMRIDLGWNDGLKTILYAPNEEPAVNPITGKPGDPSLPARNEKALRDFIASDDRFRLVIRYHPSQNIEFVPQCRVVHSPISMPLAPLLHAVDVVVVTASTVGLEAYVAGKPVVSLDNSSLTEYMPYSKKGISIGVSDLTKLRETIVSVVFPEEVEGSFSTAPLTPQPAATPKIVDGIIKLMQQRYGDSRGVVGHG